MEDFGFDRLSAAIYEALLTCGPLPRRQLLAILSQSDTRLDRGLAALQDRKLVSMDYERFQPRYYAIHPAAAWQALSTDLLWETTDTIWSSGVAPETDDRVVETRRRTCADLASVAARLSRPHVAIFDHWLWVREDAIASAMNNHLNIFRQLGGDFCDNVALEQCD